MRAVAVSLALMMLAALPLSAQGTLGACLSCATTRPPVKPISAYESFTPPANYREEFKRVQQCTKEKMWVFKVVRPGDFDEIVWLKAPGRNFWVTVKDTTELVIGVWKRVRTGRDTIVIASDWADLHDNWVVRHELVHFILQRGHYGSTGDAKKKDDEVWGTRCKAKWGFLK